MNLITVFTWILLVVLGLVKDTWQLKLCLVASVHTSNRIQRICPTLKSTLECVIGNDRFNCLRRLTIGEADIAILEPEDLVAASAYNEYNIIVTNELRLFVTAKQKFEMVALVHKDVKNIWDIKGRKYCHPGLETADDWSKAFSTYFENWIIPKECDPDKTLLENRIAGLSNYFESACIAGPWTSDAVFDSKLKSKYKNLCALCDNPAGCYTGDKYHGGEGALLCLTDNVGDIAWVRLDNTLEHFKSEQVNKSDYNYLCPDGTTRPVEFEKPCIWITKPWPVVAARAEIAPQVRYLMTSLNDRTLPWKESVLELLESYHPTPVSTETLETPEDFLRRFPGFMSANSRAGCRPSRRVQWCVASNLEDRKCRWLREASFVYGVEPAIACIQEPNRTSCLEAVRNGRADIFVARPEEQIDVKKRGLKPILRAVPKKREEFDRIAAVVKESSRFKKLSDLKGAKACFAGYKNVGWYAFESIMRNLSTHTGTACSDASAVGNFFKDSCVLGLANSAHDVPRNLYSLCQQGGHAGDDVSAFDCLTSGLGDVAIVNLRAIEEKTGKLDQRTSAKRTTDGYRILCNDSQSDTEDPSICLLTWSAPALVVAHENITELRREEIYAMLLEMDQLFGRTPKGQTSAFELYGTYDSNKSIIFPEQTHHLYLEVDQIQRVKNYDEIVDDVVRRAMCNTGHWNSYYSITFLYTMLLILSQL